MSLGQVASQPQQSATPAPSPASPSTQEAAAPPSSTPAPSPSAPAPSSEPSQQTAPPASSTPQPPAPEADWRSKIAGQDPKKVEALSRYQTQEDWANSWFEQRAALSKRAEPMRLEPNAAPEKVAEYRKAIGVPDVPADAAPEKYMEAYKLEIPKGYEASDMEKGMVSDFAKQAYEKGWSPAEVKGATDFFFQQQEASRQAINQVSVERQKEWQNALREKFGNREYDAQIAAANDWLTAQFSDNKDGLIELTRAQLPGGGYLGDHPWFVETVAKLAMGDGYTDKIEANAFESGGKSLSQQQGELEALRRSNPQLYNDPKTQSQLSKIIELRVRRGEIDEMGRPVQKRRSA